MSKPLKAAGVRVDVSRGGAETTLVFRDEAGRERQIALDTSDTSVLVGILLGTLAEAFQALQASPGGAPRPSPSKQRAVLRPLRVAVVPGQREPVLAFDFGGAVLNLALDAQVLDHLLAKLREQFPAGQS